MFDHGIQSVIVNRLTQLFIACLTGNALGGRTRDFTQFFDQRQQAA